MIWKHLGFNKDIFFVEPLRPFEEDIKLFVGRAQETHQYLVDVLSHTRSLKVVTGKIGVGKTTFVNACQYFTYTDQPPAEFQFELPHLLPCFEKVQIREDQTADDFLQQVLASVCQSIVYHCNLSSATPPTEVNDILSYFLDLNIKTGGGGFSIGALGAEVGKTQSSSTPNVIRNARVHLQNLVEIAREKLSFDGVFVTVDNLDILSKEKLVRFVNEVRDIAFDIDGVYWTLIGRQGIQSIIETEADRVADYVSGTELCLAPLDYAGTKEIVDVRVSVFKSREDVQCPLSDNAIEVLHNLTLQETRETFKICGEVVKRVIRIDPSKRIIPDALAFSAFIHYSHDRAKDLDLSSSKVRILKAVYEKQKCRPKDYAEFGYQNPQAFNTALKGLSGKGLLAVEERGTARIYRMTGMTMFAAITGALGPEIAQTATKSIKTNGHSEPKGDFRTFSEAQLELELDE